MDDCRFDALVKIIGAAPRRMLLKAIGAVVAGRFALDGHADSDAQRQPRWCVSGFHPCRSANATACCLPGQFCCGHDTDNPFCVSSRAACRNYPRPPERRGGR